MTEFFLVIGQASGAPDQSPFFLPGMLILMFGLFYVMLIRPQKLKEKERQEMIANVKRGDRVLFSGGLFGTIANTKDNTFLIKIADNVKIEVARGSVTKVLEKGEKVDEDVSLD